jgi:hypothetical protein
MWIDFVDGVKNFHNVDSNGILGFGWATGGKLEGAKPYNSGALGVVNDSFPLINHYGAS